MNDTPSRIPHLATPSPPEALGRSEAFLAFMEALSRVARVDRPVLIIGERGTGKELAATRLHFLSQRWGEPLVTLNCAALAPGLLESELFGHEAGAFTGAREKRRGRFEAAQGGALFLDELGNTPLPVQEKILRVVEYGSFERVGGSREVRVDVRLIGATNQDLRLMAARGEFKSDLLDRLSFEVLAVPPLRERGGDILLLARHFAVGMAMELGREEIPELSPKVCRELLAHPWPGNVRELKNVVERAVYRTDSALVEELDFDPFRAAFRTLPAGASVPPPDAALRSSPPSATPELPPGGLKEALREAEVRLVAGALERARHNQAEAARLLGLSYHQLRGILKKHGGAEALAQGFNPEAEPGTPKRPA